MSTRLHRPSCRCVNHARAHRLETLRVAAWSGLVLAGIYLPWYLLEWITR